MTTLYQKVGRRYVPVSELEARDALPEGVYLLTVRPGHTSLRTVVEPDHAGFEAAADDAREAMAEAVRRASEARPREARLTGKEQKAFAAWKRIMGDDVMWLTRDAAWDIAEAGIEAVRKATKGGAP